MFNISDAGVNTDNEKSGDKKSTSTIAKRPGWGLLLDVCIVLLMGGILFWGAASQFYNQFNDVTRYQCYAEAFWHGSPGLSSLPERQCAFLTASTSSTLAQKLQKYHVPTFVVNLVEAQSTAQPFHLLPPEYPFLTLVPFSLALVVPPAWYQAAFAIWMAVVAGIIYFVLKRYRSTGAAIAFAAYLVVGSWATAEGRFDLVTAALTLGAVILAAKARWKWAFALLALGTLLKFYPVVLIPPLLIAQYMQSGAKKWNAWSRWSGLAVYLAICAGVTVFSLVLNVTGTLSPFRYFFARPIEVESFPATLVWLGSFVGYPFQYEFTFQSLNVVSSLSSKIGLLSSLCLAAGLLYTFWLQWRGKIDIFMSSLLTLLIIMAAGKVLSPQYLIWVAPFVAYVGKSNWKWLVSWGCVALLTTLLFPFIFVDLPHIIKYYPLFFVRDLLMVAIVLVLLYTAGRNRQAVVEQAVTMPSIPVTSTDALNDEGESGPHPTTGHTCPPDRVP